MKSFFLVLILSVSMIPATVTSVNAQGFGVSFSFFFPRNGYFSTPISPFSIRGVGFDLNRFLAIETGATLYRMSGLNIKDLPLESKDPLLGPNFTLLVPLELVLQFVGQSQEFSIKGGGFAFYGFDNKINFGNLDRAIREFEGWQVANAQVSGENNIGLGFHFGAEYIFYLNSQFGISVEGNYFIGDANFPLTGNYTGGPENGPLVTREVDFSDGKIDFTGFEISLGVIFNN